MWKPLRQPINNWLVGRILMWSPGFSNWVEVAPRITIKPGDNISDLLDKHDCTGSHKYIIQYLDF